MKCGNYGKKNDMNDISLFSGRAYMPEENAYEHYLRTVPQLQKEVSLGFGAVAESDYLPYRR